MWLTDFNSSSWYLINYYVMAICVKKVEKCKYEENVVENIAS